MQVNSSYSNVFQDEPEDVFFSVESEEEGIVESEEEGINENVKRCAGEAWKQIAPEIKKTLIDVLDKKVDLLSVAVTASCTKAVTENSPALVAGIVNPMIETSVKNTSKKVTNCAVDKCIDKTEKTIPVVIDFSHKKSNESSLGWFFRSSPSVANEKK